MISPLVRALARGLARVGRRREGTGDDSSALWWFVQALRLSPSDLEIRLAAAIAMARLGMREEAAKAFGELLKQEPNHAEALVQRGRLLFQARAFAKALSDFERALASDPQSATAAFNRASTLLALGRPAQAAAGFKSLSARYPDDAEVHNHCGSALAALRRQEDALERFNRALRLRADYADALFNRAVLLLDMNRPEDAANSLRALVAQKPDYPWARGKLLYAKMLTCDWDGLEALAQEITSALALGQPAAEPFCLLGIAESPKVMQESARVYSQVHQPPMPGADAGESVSLGRDQEAVGSRAGLPRRIRLGYLSGEFRQQATAVLAAELFELHDRVRFEVVAFDAGWSDDSPMRCRLEAAFDEWVMISGLDDEAAAAAIRDCKIDLLVDLNGFFGQARPGVFARRPAKVQIAYLGFPGTMGAPGRYDYLLADRCVVPDGHRCHYDEQVVWLPSCYQINDRHRLLPDPAVSRTAVGLAEDALVLCCFNNPYKITPPVFDIWMELLRAEDRAVLWLLEYHPSSSSALRVQAAKRGVSPERLRFSPTTHYQTYLGRLALADLFVDTHPCSAHTTASDALWAGLPLLTCEAGGFAGRVAASVLRAAGLQEWVTTSLPEYRARALNLVANPEEIDRWRCEWAALKAHCDLFDTPARCRDIENAYLEMMTKRLLTAPLGPAR